MVCIVTFSSIIFPLRMLMLLINDKVKIMDGPALDEVAIAFTALTMPSNAVFAVFKEGG